MNLSKQDTQPATPSYRTIPLTKGKVAIVDAQDYALLSQRKWIAIWNRKGGRWYAAHGCVNNGKWTTMYMHRVILGIGFGDKRRVDHVTRELTLDNRRSNLRVATVANNSHNSGAHRDNKSGFKGVSFGEKGRWKAQICHGGKNRNLGIYDTPEEAARVYDGFAKALFGVFAHLNFPKS